MGAASFSTSFLSEVADIYAMQKTAAHPILGDIAKGTGKVISKYLGHLTGTAGSLSRDLSVLPSMRAYSKGSLPKEVQKLLNRGHISKDVRFTERGLRYMLRGGGWSSVDPYAGQSLNKEVVDKLKQLARARNIRRVTRATTGGAVGFQALKHRGGETQPAYYY